MSERSNSHLSTVFCLTMMSRLVSSQLRNTVRTAVNESSGIKGACRSMTVLSKESAETFKEQNYSKRMDKTGRPVSPHVTIYRFPITALSSITNRVTGVCLSLGCAGLGAAEVFGGSGSALYISSDLIANHAVLAPMAKFCIAFPLTFHYLGGLRHLVWDEKPEMLTNQDVERTSYALFGASAVVSGLAMFI